MKIAFVSPDLSPRTGSRRYICELTPCLRNLGHEVKIFTTKLDKQTCFEEYLSLPVEIIGARSRRTLSESFESNKKNLLFGAGKEFAFQLMHTFHIMDISKRIADMGCQVAVLQYHGEHWLLPWFYHFEETAGVVSLNVLPRLSSQGLPADTKIVNKLLNSSPVGIWQKMSYRKIALFLAKSKYVLKQADELGIIGQRRTAIVPSGVNHSEFYPTGEEEPFALYLGRIDPAKSLELAIYAMAKTGHDSSLVIAGDLDSRYPRYKEKLEKIAERLKISDRFKIIPSPSDSEGVRLMQKCSVFLFPSTIDTFGLVVLEALACGKPMVACNRGGVPEIVGDAGFLLEPNIEEWQKTVNKLMSNSELRKKLGEKSLERSNSFSWEKTAERLVDTFTSLLYS
jgi:glycosyltransferase involved in cell wall biosynthesis